MAERNTQGPSPRSILLILFLFVSSIGSLRATHIVGGELNYECLGNDQYEISLTIFRDCFNGNPQAYFDDPASIGVFDSNNNLVTSIGQNGQLLIPLMGDDTLNPTLFDTCLVIPPEVCVHRTTYVSQVTLPFRPGGYQLSYQRCCRNQTILNIVDPLATGATYYNFISEQALQECNSSAVFNEWPPTFICVNEPILFDHSATDIDGDSLVYKLCTPFEGADQNIPQPQPPNPPPYDSVVWQNPPYNLFDMMGGTPLEIDSETGFLTGTPNTIGQFVVGICVEEYRNGQLISTSKRDFQYNVGVCGEAISSFFAPEVDCDGFTVNFTNESENAESYEWDFGDPNTTNDVSTGADVSYVYPDTGLYVVTLIADPFADCADTSYATVSVQYPSLFVDFDLDLIDGCVFPAQIDFQDLTYDTISNPVEWFWEFSDGTTSDEQNPTKFVTDNGTFVATLTVTAENGCQVTHQEFIPVDVLELELQDTQGICVQGSTTLNQGSSFQYQYNWSPTETLGNPSAPSPVAFPSETTTYYVTVTNPADNCVYVDSTTVIVDDLVVDFDDVVPFCEGDTVQLHDGNEPNLNYFWSGGPNIINPFSGSAQANPSEAVTYNVNVQDLITGCTYQDTVRVEPIITQAIPIGEVICEGESVQLDVIADPSYEYEWAADPTLSNTGIANPIASPTETTTYYITVTEPISGCEYLDSTVVTVNNFQTSFTDPTVCIGEQGTLNPGGNPNFGYEWSPGGSLSDPNAASPTFTASSSTEYYVTVTDPVTGCLHLDTVDVFVPEELEVTTSGGQVSCDPDVDISASSNTGVSYAWYENPDLTGLVGTGADQTVFPGALDDYFVLVTDQYGCSASASIEAGSNSVQVSVEDVEICEQDSAMLLAINNDPSDILTYVWEPDNAIVDGAGTDNPTVFVDSDAVITLYAENQFGCRDTVEALISVNENNLGIIATADPDSIYPGESTQLDATSGNGFVYQWIPSEFLDNDEIRNPLATPPDDQVFTVFVSDPVSGCEDTANISVVVRTFFCDEPFIFVPNAFSPNGDGRNDVFYVRGNAIDEMYMAVYNRWGEKVFETSDPNEGWNGTFKGKELPPDVFGYYLQLKCLNGEEYFKKGNVTLLK